MPFSLKIFLFLSVFSVVLSAQNATVSGQITSEDGAPLEGAAIEIYTEDSTTPVNGALSDEKGKFRIEDLPFGNYNILITAVGFIEHFDALEANQKNTEIPIIFLSQGLEIEEVQIRAETSKITQEIDKRVIDIGKDLVAAGATAGEVLNNIPSLSVDQESGALALRGNANVKVFLDGKPSQIPAEQLLRQLPSNSISKVEIITNPSSKYDPEGNSGIINIITYKEKRRGYNVTTTLGYSNGRKERYNASISGNVNTGNLNFFANYGNNFGENQFLAEIQNFTNNLGQDLDMIRDSDAHLVKFGFDWFLTEKTALTIYTNQSFFDQTNNRMAIVYALDGSNSNLDLSESLSDRYNSDYSLNIKTEFDEKDHYLELDALYSYGDNQGNDFFNWQSLGNNGNFDETTENQNDNIRLNLDYAKPVGEGGKIETGIQYRFENTENLYETNRIGVFDTDFDFERAIYSAYLNYGKQWDKLGIQLGVRVENVIEDALTNASDNGISQDNFVFENDYFQFYPSVFLTYQLTESEQIALNYSRRVERPGIWQVSPIRRWQSALARSIGNPNLLPQFSNSIEFTYLKQFNKNKGSIIGSLFYRYITDEITRFATIDPDNPNQVVFQDNNIPNNNAYGAELSGFLKPLKWWSFNGGIDWYLTNIKGPNGGTGELINVEASVFNFRISNDFTLIKDLKLQSFTMLRGGMKTLQGNRDSMFRQDLGLSYTFSDGKGTINARYSDMFNTFFRRGELNNPTIQIGEFNWESQVFYVGLTYTFGGKVKTRRQKNNRNGEGRDGGMEM